MSSFEPMRLHAWRENTGAVARRVLTQIARDRRFLMTVLVAPLLIVFFIETLFDAAGTQAAVTTGFVLPFAAYIVHFLTFILTAIVLVRERVANTLERMFVNGFRQSQIIIGYLVAYTAVASLVSLFVLLELEFLFDLGYSVARLAAIYVVMWALAIISMALGILVSNFAETEGQVIPFVPLVIIPSFLFAGIVVAVDRLPVWAQVISRLSPMYYANNILNEIISSGSLVSDTASVVMLPVYGLAVLLLATLTLRERT